MGASTARQLALLPILAAIALLPVCNACSSGGSGHAAPDSGTDTDADADTDSDSDTGTGYDTDPCDELEFPPSNGPDGCSRTLLPIHSLWISRDGSVAVGTPYYFLSDEDDDAMDDIIGPYDLEPGCYALDLETMEAEMVSVDSEEEPADTGECGERPGISADGRFVAFETEATNLDPLDANICSDVYLRDRELGTTEWISVSSQSGLDYGAWRPVVSADGRYILFDSSYSDLVPDDTNGKTDLFLRDRELEVTERINVDDDGGEVDGDLCGNLVRPISDDGRYAAFGHESALSPDDDDPEEWETDDKCDIYRRDRQTGTNLLITEAPDGFSEAKPRLHAMAPDGSWLMFETSGSEHYYDASSSDWETRTIIARVDGSEVSFEPILLDWTDFSAFYNGVSSAASTDARYIGFASTNPDLVEHVGTHGDAAIENAFVLDRDPGTVTLVTAAEDGTPGITMYYEPMVDWVELAVSGDGRRIVFSTIQYGIVDPYAHDIPCINTPHLVYLRDCP